MNYSLDQLRSGEVSKLGASRWIAVEQSRILDFAEATEDRQWIHTDPERAKDSPLGTTIAHGFLLISLVPHLFEELFQVPEAEMLINYGLDKVRFIQPVPAGAEVRLDARLQSVTEKDSGNLMLRLRGNLVLRAEDGSPGRRAVVIEMIFVVVPPAQ